MHPLLSRLRRNILDESGQTILLFALLLPVLFGFAAIAIDIGILRYQKEQLQSAADAAAIAAGLELSYCNGVTDCGAMQTAVLQSMSENGYTNVTLNTQCSGTTSPTGVTLTLNNGPCELGTADPSNNNKDAVEVIATKEAPTYFGRILGFDQVSIAARAEAAQGSSPYCIYIGASPAGSNAQDVPQAILVNSGGHLTASCGLMDDSTDGTALLANSGAHITTTENDIHGGDLINGNGNSVHISPAVTTGAAALPDPLSGTTTPANPGGCTSLTGGISGSLSAGCYSGLTVSGKLSLASGLYYITGPLIINSGSSVTGTDVTLFLTGGGSLTMNSGSNLSIAAPAGTSSQTGTSTSSNALYNIALYQDASDTNTIIYDGGSKSALQGIVYAPGAQLDINSGGNSAAYTILDIKQLYLNGGAKLNIGADYSSQPDGKSPVKGVTAVLSE